MNRFFVCSITAILLASCSPTVFYTADYPLTETTFQTPDGNLSGRIPQGWTISSDDSSAASSLLVFTNNAFSQSIILNEIQLDSLTSQQVDKQGLELLAHIAAGMRGASSKNSEVQKFRFRSSPMCGIEWKSGNGIERLVVFSKLHHFYTCEAKVIKGSPTPEENKQLFSVQQTLLQSIGM